MKYPPYHRPVGKMIDLCYLIKDDVFILDDQTCIVVKVLTEPMYAELGWGTLYISEDGCVYESNWQVDNHEVLYVGRGKLSIQTLEV